MRDIKTYDVFHFADQLVFRVNDLTREFPREELFGLSAQMRRAAASIPMNLAEGAARCGSREFANFVNIAIGSVEEVRYQLHLAAGLKYVTEPQREELDRRYEQVKRMLSGLYAKLTGRKTVAAADSEDCI